MKGGNGLKLLAFLLIGVFAIVLIMNSMNVTGEVIKIIPSSDPSCSVNGFEGKIVIDEEQKVFSSKYSTVSEQKSTDWLNDNIRACNRAKESFDQRCGTMFGDCRTHDTCEIIDSRESFNCDVNLPQRCTLSQDGDYKYSCSIDAATIALGSCTCEKD